MNPARAIVSVWCAALCAALLLLLPGDWKGLAILPALTWWAAWSLLGQRYRALHELNHELDDDQAAELDNDDGWGDDEHDDDWPPSEADDPVSYYAMLARRYAGSEQWEQRGPDDTGPHLLTAPGPAGVLQPMRGPVPNPGGPAAADSDTGEAGPPAEPETGRCEASAESPRADGSNPSPVSADSDTGEAGPPADRDTCPQCMAPLTGPECNRCSWPGPIILHMRPELDHTAELDDQADELDPDAWPDPYDLAAATLLRHTRAEFDLLRRMWL